MSIRTKTLGITTLALLFVLIIVYAMASPLILADFKDVEQADAQQNVRRVTDVVHSELESLSAKVYDWANWDDAYQFVLDQNQDFIDSNFGGNEAYETPIFDTLIFYNSQRKLVYSNGARAVPDELKQQLTPDHPLLEFADATAPDPDTSARTTVMNIGTDILFIAARPQLPADHTGPSRGTLLFIKYLDSEDERALANTTHLNLSLYTLNDPTITSDARPLISTLKKDEIVIKELNEDNIAGYTLINDINDKPVILARVAMPRPIYNQGLESLRVFLIILVSVGAVFVLITLSLLEWMVIRRMTNLSAKVAQIKDENNLDDRIQVHGTDEVATLGSSINHMLNRIKSSTARISELLAESRHYQSELEKEKGDIEQQVRQRTFQLENEKARFLASINSLPLGFILLDASNHILMINPRMQQLLNITGGQSVEKAAEQHPIIQKLMLESQVAIKTKTHTTTSHSTPDGKFWQVMHAPVLSGEGTANGVVILIEDITEAKILDRSKNEFFSIASHELRTPLTAIRGNSSMMKHLYGERLKDENFNHMINSIHTSSVQLINIVNDFLDISRIEQDRITFNTTTFKLEDLVKEVMGDMNSVITEKNVYLKLTPVDQPLPDAYADTARVKQVMYNLIGNALKFTKEGGITITIQVMPDQMLKVLLRDTGAGISKENQQLLFHKFQQAGDSLYTRDTSRGTGLGLYISKLIIERMGGQIRMEESTEGVGSTFSFTLPTAENPLVKKRSATSEK